MTWLSALCLISSALARIAIPGLKGSGDPLYVCSQILLPSAAALIYVLIIFSAGNDRFYQTAIPVWMMAAYYVFYITRLFDSKLIISLFFVCLLFFAVSYTGISSTV